MPKNKRPIEVVPVWRTQPDRQHLIAAFVAFVRQLADEAQATTADESQEVAHG